jgi:hypothetical protein
MRTKTELQQDILNIAMKIQMEFPALTKYIEEMPSLFLAKEPDHEHTKKLELYYNKLTSALAAYRPKQLNLKPTFVAEVINFSSHADAPLSKETYTYGKVDTQIMSGNH